MVTTEAALAALAAAGDGERAVQMAAYHKSTRPFFGVPVPQIDALVKAWRVAELADRVALADGLWQAGVHEARVAAAKLLDQSRFRPTDAPVWAQLVRWLPDLDGWAIADHVMIAGQKRVVADPRRIDEVEGWTRSPSMWVRRAALVVTLPFAKSGTPKPVEAAVRARVLGWAGGYVADPEWFMQKVVAWWLRDLSKHNPDQTRAFLEVHGGSMKAFARKEASKYLPGCWPGGPGAVTPRGGPQAAHERGRPPPR